MGDPSEFSKLPNKYKTALERYFFGRFMHQRASGRVYQRYRINAFELDLLMMLNAHCARHGKMIVTKHHFFSELTGNSRRKAKYEGYLTGLRNKMFVGSYEYVGYPGKLSIGISKVGWKVLEDFYKALDELIESKEKKGNCWDMVLPGPDYETSKQKLIAA